MAAASSSGKHIFSMKSNWTLTFFFFYSTIQCYLAQHFKFKSFRCWQRKRHCLIVFGKIFERWCYTQFLFIFYRSFYEINSCHGCSLFTNKFHLFPKCTQPYNYKGNTDEWKRIPSILSMKFNICCLLLRIRCSIYKMNIRK